MRAVTKTYDKAYFDRWYRGRGRVHSPGEVRRKVMLAVTTAEYFLGRTIRSVLDAGCGEGAWLPHLREARPKVSYLGFDPSEYAVERFGDTRNIRRASFDQLTALRLDRRFDLVVCSDVLHYLTEKEILAGFPGLASAAGGVAFIEVLTKEDEIVGDLQGLLRRPADWYRELMSSAGFAQVAPYCWLTPSLAPFAAEMELA